eukprot:4735594-Amphidinium_carterae.1
MASDAEMSYIQATLQGIKTWVRLPKDQWPAAWRRMRDRVCPLVRALYGHPDAGGYWERHCEKQVRSVGFVPVPKWNSVFYHPQQDCLLVVYVDDFKMAESKDAVPKMFAKLAEKIKMDAPTSVDRFLGCHHKYLPDKHVDGHVVRRLEYDMSSFFASAVQMYYELAGPNSKPLKKVDTPYIPEKELMEGYPDFADPKADRQVEDSAASTPQRGGTDRQPNFF